MARSVVREVDATCVVTLWRSCGSRVVPLMWTSCGRYVDIRRSVRRRVGRWKGGVALALGPRPRGGILCSPAFRHINGGVLVADGGQSLANWTDVLDTEEASRTYRRDGRRCPHPQMGHAVGNSVATRALRSYENTSSTSSASTGTPPHTASSTTASLPDTRLRSRLSKSSTLLNVPAPRWRGLNNVEPVFKDVRRVLLRCRLKSTSDLDTITVCREVRYALALSNRSRRSSRTQKNTWLFKSSSHSDTEMPRRHCTSGSGLNDS